MTWKDILFSIIFLILFLLIIYLFQRHLIYFPDKNKPDLKDFAATDMQLIKIVTADGLTLTSWYKPAQNKKPTVLYVHGNAGHIGYRMPLAHAFTSAGFGVLLLEYRGYGGNPGKPTESGLYEDGKAAVNFLLLQGVSENKLVFYGESLGTGIAIYLATQFAPCAVVLQSPYTSLTDLARYHYPWLPLPVMDKYDSFSRIQSIHSPLLALHGEADDVVPFAQGLSLFNQAKQPKKWIAFPNKGHHDLWTKNFAADVINFINTSCTTQDANKQNIN